MTLNRHICQTFCLVISTYGIMAIAIACMMQVIDTGGWAGVDADRFHEMARIIINGFTPYVNYIDPKPPLLFFTVSAMDLVQPSGVMDLPVITLINISCALLVFSIGYRDYGYISGFFAGLLYLVVAAFTQGYILFSEQFALLFLLLALISVRKTHYICAGICVGIALGFKQYAILSLIPLVYLMWMQGERRVHLLLLPAVIAGLSSFGVVLLVYGNTAAMSALFWTFGVAPAYAGGQAISAIPSYQTNNLFSYSVYLISSIFVVLPLVLFSGASLVRRGLRNPAEQTIFIFAAVFVATLFIRQYLHYWLLVLPFLALLAGREFADSKNG